MFKNALIISAIAIGALTSNGSGPVNATGLLDQNRRPVPAVPATEAVLEPGEDVRDEFHQTYPLAPNGRVSVENINGAVQIKVWDQPSVQVDAVKRANRRERLAEAKIDVYTTPESIRIRTVYPDWDQTFTDYEKGRYNNPATVDYTVTVRNNGPSDAQGVVITAVLDDLRQVVGGGVTGTTGGATCAEQIGRASCRERVCLYV